METILGQTVDNYKILEVLGRGGMGVVFKALDLNLEKTVALKMIDPFLARDENFLRRFKTEAKALAKLEDRNIVSVFALRETEYGLFMVMEYVHAKTVSEWIRDKGRFTSKETIEITKQLLHAINCAHKAGVIHRDIKPNNIMLCDDGTVKVMDFGLAKVIQENSAQTNVTQAAAGTLYYMSPEQVKGLKNVDHRSDIYSIGMTIYEMLAGRTPFEKSESEFAIQKLIVEGKIPTPAKYNPAIPKSLVKFIMKAIEKDANDRYQNITEMLEAISHLDSESEVADDKTKVISSDTNIDYGTNHKGRKVLIFASVAFILILVSGYLLFFNDSPTEQKREDQKLVINQNKEKKIEPTIIPASLTITSTPKGASVFINNVLSGKTPITKDSLQGEQYSIILKLNGYEQWANNSYEVKSGNNSLDVKLKPIVTDIKPAVANSSLVLKMDVQGRIFIDNQEEATSSSEIIKSNLKPGNYKVKFEHPEYGSKETTINLGENQKKELTCYFQQTVSINSLNTSGESFWGTIYINGENTNKTTPAEIILSPGKYKITVKKAGYTPVEREIVLDIKPAFELSAQSLVFHLQ